jgi:NAD(P)-dependent dehydrogenase (short-subunit alcohol dehydrogenase family)
VLVMDGTAIYPSLEGRGVLVTGGGSGIGAEIARAFVRNRARVAILDLAADEPADGVQFFACDLTDVSALRATVERVEAALGPIGALVNNAANDQRYELEDIGEDDWDASQAVNLRHQFFMAQAVAPGMRANGGGSIVNLSSGAWRRGTSQLVPYATAKAGVLGLTNSLATALGPDHIRVNAIAPGAVMTPRQMRLWHTEESRARMLALQAIPADVTERDVAAAALFLAADDSGMITRQCLYVDGGMR